jgi:bacteriocin biosynthesis cyclodehydratase domain-containing protein
MSDRIGLLAAGPIADAALRLLAARDGQRRIVQLSGGRLADGQEPFEKLVVALWRPAPQLCRTVDALAAEHGFGWLPAEADGATLRVGPWFEPHGPICLPCFAARRDQHDEQATTNEAVHEAYDRDPGLGPRGHLPQHARLLAGLIEEALSAPRPAQVVSVNRNQLRLTRHTVVATADCERCWAAGSGTGQPTETTLAGALARAAKESEHADA